MIELFFIRHGKTYGNTLGRYIGTTDEELCEEGREALLETARYLACQGVSADAVYVSPLKRCVQTAEILFPGVQAVLVPELRECDFGEFENRNYKELSGNPEYQAWVDSGGTLSFPGGESREEFQARCLAGFLKVLEELQSREKAKEPAFRAAFVVHGGTIMSILGAFASPKEDFYRWQAKNGQGFRCFWDERAGLGREEITLYEISNIGADTGRPA